MRVGILIVCLYVITAYLGLKLAVPSGYATAIWAPAGIALGATLVWGLRSLPSIFLGSFIINFYISYLNTESLLIIFFAATIIAVGAVLQAWFGWWLIRRFLVLEEELIQPRDILLFAFLSGPVSCLVSASWSVTGLYLLNMLRANNMFLSWMTWWVGDSIGSLLVTPLFLIGIRKTKLIWKDIIIQRILPLSIPFFGIIFIYSIVITTEIDRLKVQFEAKTKNIVDKFVTQLNISMSSSYALTAHLSVIPQVIERNFKEYTQAVIARQGAKQILAWVPEINNKQHFKDQYHVAITPIADNQSIAGLTQPLYYPILYAVPNINKELVGLDLFSNPRYAQALQEAKFQHKMVVLAPIQLLKSKPSNTGALLISPVYNKHNFWGFSLVFLDLAQISDDIFKNNQDYYSFSITNKANNQEILVVDTRQAMAQDPKYSMTYYTSLEVGNMTWLVKAVSSMSYINHAFSWQVWSLLPECLLFCVLMNIILLILYGQKSLIQLKVNEQSSLLRAEEAKNLLVLNSAGEGILELDVDGKILFSNPAAQSLLGYEPQELSGKTIPDLSRNSPKPTRIILNSESIPVSSSERDKLKHITDEIFYRKDDSSFNVEYSITPIKKNNTIIGAVVVFNDVTERHENQIKIERMARFDMLTKLPNRFNFMDYLAQALARAKRNKSSMAIFFIDVDNFKQINDNYGHLIGDKVLSTIPKLLSQRLRDIDFLGRLGGDEFGLILENINDELEIDMVAENYIKLLSKPLKIFNQEINTSITIGIAIYPQNGINSEELIKNADIAMYHAKEEGKNTFAFFSDEMNTLHKRRHEVDLALRRAIENKEFYLVYQPQLDITTYEIKGVEVLIRMASSLGVVANPAEFIPVAENNGLIHDIGKWVLEQVAHDYPTLVKNIPGLKITINTSVKQLETPSFDKYIHGLMSRMNINPQHIYFEVTETALLRNPDRMLKMMHQLKDQGIRFALDDFGMGYSSMNYLKKLPISIIKIDQSFVKDMANNPYDLAIVNATIKLAHGLNIITIAEGVEDKEQFLNLQTSGCDQIQGYYLAKPMPIHDLMEWVNSDFRDALNPLRQS